ncbi:MAG: hypothetical protein JWR74_2631 [Polaromonas sp.]|nr:hypothetical protein [Polaromonas sp.]
MVTSLPVHHIGLATAPALYKKLPYKTLEDFEYLGLLNERSTDVCVKLPQYSST